MAEREVSVLIGGRAGDGVSSAGQIIAHLLAKNGYRVHMYFDYPSLIKGGHNFAIIRGAEEGIGAVREQDGVRCLVVAGRSEYYKSLAEDEFVKLFSDILEKG